MKDLESIKYHPTSEKIVDVLCDKLQRKERTFFRILTAYYFAKLASSMRVNIETHDRGLIPVNLYAINLGESGLGKGHSTNIIEEQIIHKFRENFMEHTFPTVSEISINKLAAKRSAKNGTDLDTEEMAVRGEFIREGNYVFSFDSATSAAVKQMRQKLLMSRIGSINLEIDEIGSNLLSNVDALKVFFELFDVGKVKQKLTKNTADNSRGEELHGRTPTNMLLFGTPSKLFDGGRTEEEMISMFETGMARRCWFGLSELKKISTDLTPDELYDILTDNSASNYLINLANDLRNLADISKYNLTLKMSKEVALLLLKYKSQCEKEADLLRPHETIRKAEIAHRYFKVLKLAGAYAFVDNMTEIHQDHIYNAIKLAEDSGNCFKKLLTRDKNYERLAKYLAEAGKEVTHVDLVEDLPFYKGHTSTKQEMMDLAVAYGYKNNIIIKKFHRDGIEFLEGETLKATDLDKITLSYSNDIAYNYINATIKFNQLHKLTQKDNMHWCANQFSDGHRCDSSVEGPFNLVVLDIDGEVSLETAKLLLKDYTYLIYTTKRHSELHNRYRIIMPMSHNLELSKQDYAQFMSNVYAWLPFKVDTATNDRARKWLTHNGHYEYNDGDLLDSLLFIPKTTKNDKQQAFVATYESLSNMERWFLRNTSVGNRSNQLIRYAFMLVDTGMSILDIRDKVLALNAKLKDKMDENEISNTILSSVATAIEKRDLSRD